MKMIKYLAIFVVSVFALFAKDVNYKLQQEVVIESASSNRPIIIENSNSIIPQSREEIDLYVEDFEGDISDWSTGSGWSANTSDFNSSTTSMVSPNDVSTQGNVWDLVSPTITLPALGEGETMNFSFFLKGDTPDTDGNGDNYLEDYYSVSILDLDALAWQETSANGGEAYWCGEDDIGNGNPGYLNDWLQFLDTPSFTVPFSGVLSADMAWFLEEAAGATVAGTCVDGWDAANVRISADGGQTWNLLTANERAYDFDCGYGWLHHDTEYDTGGALNDLAPGWGGVQDWTTMTFNIGAWTGQDVIVRFAFGSDPGFCTLDDPTATGFYVDNISVSGGALDCSPESDCDVVYAGEVWVDQFYDYCDETRPGYQQWEQYTQGMPFNGNVFLDISDLAGKDIAFRFQTRYDEDDDGGSGIGIMVDDLRIYKVSGGNYPPPTGLAGEGLNESVELTWNDMNASGTDDFIFDNESFTNGIQMSTEGSTAYAGTQIPLAGPSTVNSVSVYNLSPVGTTTTIAAFSQVGTLFSNEPTYSLEVTLESEGWNDFDVSTLGWDMNNSFIVAHQFTFVDETTGAGMLAALDESAVPSSASRVLFPGGAWDAWSVSGAAIGDGEWGIRSNVTFQGAGVTYNVHLNGNPTPVLTNLGTNSATVDGLENNTTYSLSVSANYSDGETSEQSDSIDLTPQAQTVHEEYYDDGIAEEYFSAGSSNFTAVKYTAQSTGEGVVRFKWFQEVPGGAFYLKLYEDVNGVPGAETYSRVIAGGLVDGWNTYDLSAEGLFVSGDFWIGTKEFSSTAPFGLDTSSNTGNSYSRTGTTGDWVEIPGNLMARVYLDCGDDCQGGGSCTLGDVSGDTIINVLDIVATVNFVLGAQAPTDDQSCAADYNEDGIINVLDIVAIVNVVLGG